MAPYCRMHHHIHQKDISLLFLQILLLYIFYSFFLMYHSYRFEAPNGNVYKADQLSDLVGDGSTVNMTGADGKQKNINVVFMNT